MDVGAASNAPPSRRCCYALLERHTASRRATHRRSGTSDPIAVRPRETLDVVASVEIEGLSSAAGARLAYLGAAGQVRDTVKVLTADPGLPSVMMKGQAVRPSPHHLISVGEAAPA